MLPDLYCTKSRHDCKGNFVFFRRSADFAHPNSGPPPHFLAVSGGFPVVCSGFPVVCSGFPVVCRWRRVLCHICVCQDVCARVCDDMCRYSKIITYISYPLQTDFCFVEEFVVLIRGVMLYGNDFGRFRFHPTCAHVWCTTCLNLFSRLAPIHFPGVQKPDFGSPKTPGRHSGVTFSRGADFAFGPGNMFPACFILIPHPCRGVPPRPASVGWPELWIIAGTSYFCFRIPPVARRPLFKLGERCPSTWARPGGILALKLFTPTRALRTRPGGGGKKFVALSDQGVPRHGHSQPLGTKGGSASSCGKRPPTCQVVLREESRIRH
jgi:hypothetical protein